MLKRGSAWKFVSRISGLLSRSRVAFVSIGPVATLSISSSGTVEPVVVIGTSDDLATTADAPVASAVAAELICPAVPGDVCCHPAGITCVTKYR